MGVIGAVINQAKAIPGITAIMPVLYFGRVPDTVGVPYGLLTDQGRDAMIDAAAFENPQVLTLNLLFQFWTSTLEVAEAWAALMDTSFAWGEVNSPPYGVLAEGVSVGRVMFEQEIPRNMSASLVHRCDYPVKVPVVLES